MMQKIIDILTEVFIGVSRRPYLFLNPFKIHIRSSTYIFGEQSCTKIVKAAIQITDEKLGRIQNKKFLKDTQNDPAVYPRPVALPGTDGSPI